MLTTYLQSLQNLIQAPTSPTPLVATARSTDYINVARKQLAADAECVRTNGTLSVTGASRLYAFSQIVLPPSVGLGSVISIRSGLVGGQQNLEIRNWEWFQAYVIGSPVAGIPAIAAQQGQGSAGVIWFAPIPNSTSSIVFDCVCLPIDLVDDTTVEAIPDMWRDAVPFYAAWLAMQSLQRQADAEAMLRRYMMLARRGRQFATPSELPENMPGGAGTQMAAARTTLGEPAVSGGR